MEEPLVRYEHLGALFDHLSLGVLIISSDRRIRFMNRSAETLTEHSAEEVIGFYCHEVFLSALCNGKCPVPEPFETLSGPTRLQVQMIDAEGRPNAITKIVTPLYGPDGKGIGCMEIFHDDSAFWDLINRVRYEDRRLKMILDNLDIGVLTVDRGGHINFFNQMAETLSEYPREEILGKTAAALFGEEISREMARFDHFDKIDAKDGKGGISREGELKTREGRVVPVRVNTMSLKNEEGKTVGGLTTVSDLSLVYELNRAIRDQHTFYDMVGKDPAMQKIFNMIPVIAASAATVLIEGATGTGKDLMAKLIHGASPRKKKPFVRVNCAALPDTLLESEIFGYVKGAFTGADRDKPGRFQDADGGTLFLDEIGDLPLSLQAKLLHVLEAQEFYPLGGRKPVQVDVRIIAATNQGLDARVREKRFREDLFYRLNVIRLEIPGLKERPADVPLLITHILKRLSAAQNAGVCRISAPAMEILLNHDYPGNVREMENILEHALIICQGETIEPGHLPTSLLKARTRQTFDSGDIENGGHSPERSGGEKGRILKTLEEQEYHLGKTARALGMHRTTLWRKMNKYDITVDG